MNVIQKVEQIFTQPNYGELQVLNVSSDSRQFSINIKNTKDLPTLSRKNTYFRLTSSDKNGEFIINVNIDSITYLVERNEIQLSFNFNDLIQLQKRDEITWNIQIVKKDLLKVNNFDLYVKKSVNPLLHTQRVYRDGYVFTPQKGEESLLTLNQINENQSNKINHFINTVENVQKRAQSLIIQGNVNSKLLEEHKPIDHITFVMRERGKTKTNEYKINWLSKDKWEVEIPFEDFPSKNRTLDFYFNVKKDNSIYEFRVKQIDHLDFSQSTVYLPHMLKGAMEFKAYQTELYSFSIKASSKTAKLEELMLDNKSMEIEGVIKSNLNLNQSTHLVFKERDSNNEFKYPIQLTRENKKYIFSSQLNAEDLYQIKYRIYDVFIEHQEDNRDLLIRLKTNNQELKYETMEEHSTEDALYQFCFYATENNRLSFRSIPATITSELQKVELTDDKLILIGQASLDRKNLEDRQKQQPIIVLKNRETEDEVTFYQESTTIDTEIPFIELKQLISDSKEILDLYVRVQVGNYVKERKLGFKEFEYYKDDYLCKSLIKEEKVSTQLFLTLTPNGNVKIEAYKQPNDYLMRLEDMNEKSMNERNVWIIGERPDTAQDTGYHFFKYLRENYPKKEVYYVIEEDSKDVKNVSTLGNVLFIGSSEHIEKCLQAEAFFCSHDIEYILPFKNKEMKNYREGLRVFLQHGVLGRKNVEYHKSAYKYPFNIFCVSSKAEKRMVMDEFKYDEAEVKVTGLSRFDHLFNYETKQKILLIPTWREWLTSYEVFKESEYFQRYLSLLQNKRLHELLVTHDLTMDFYLHYRMQQYLEEIELNLHPNIRLVRTGEEKVQGLLKSSRLMITDYSSVSFDFNFMAKPIIFYHFDLRHFFSSGMLRPKEETFLGDIVHKEEAVVDQIEYYISNGFKEKDDVSNNKDQIFTYMDQNNCKRILEVANNYSKDM